MRRIAVIPTAQHAANLDNPDFFHAALMDFQLSSLIKPKQRGAP